MITKPAIYVSWAVIVVAALAGTYFSDPYIFAFTAIGLAWTTALVAVVGLSAIVLRGTARPGDRLLIVGAILSAVAAVAVAFGVLRTFNWA